MTAPSDPERPRLAIVDEVGAELHRLFRAEEARTGILGTIVVRRIRMRPRVTVALLAVLVAATGAAAAVSLSGGRTAPVGLPGGGVLCPVGYEYLAYPSLKLVYPPNYPGALPRNARGASCYESEQAARSAGYTTAPTPSGDARIGPLYVADASAVVLRVCRSAQRLVGVAVYCPRRLPTPWQDTTPDSIPAPPLTPDCPTAGCSIPLLYISGSFSAPSSYGVGEVSVWAASTSQQRLYPYLVSLDGLLGCNAAARTTSHTVFRGQRATWYDCPTQADNKSAVLEWHAGTEVYGISASGPANFRRRLIEYIAAHLVRLAPTH